MIILLLQMNHRNIQKFINRTILRKDEHQGWNKHEKHISKRVTYILPVPPPPGRKGRRRRMTGKVEAEKGVGLLKEKTSGK